MAETVSKAHALLPRFSQEICVAMVHPLGLLYIGGAAHFVWAYPPNFGRTAYRHVQVHRRTTEEYSAVADAMMETIHGLDHGVGHPLTFWSRPWLAAVG